MSDTALIPFATPAHDAWRPTSPGGASLLRRVLGAVRYGGVLAVWAAFFLARPGEAMEIFRERRSNSPLRW